MIDRYVHHKVPVFVRADLKGRHWEFCLCNKCKNLKMGEPDNCPIANEVYQTCLLYDLVTPIFECPVYNGPMGDEELRTFDDVPDDCARR